MKIDVHSIKSRMIICITTLTFFICAGFSLITYNFVNSSYSQTILVWVLAIACLIFLILSVVVSFLFAGKISKQLKGAVSLSDMMARGDFSFSIREATLQRKDELGLLANSFFKINNNLNDIISRISASAEQVYAGAAQISDSSMVLSQGATEQASSIEQLSASVEQISAQTNLNANSAKDADQIARDACQKAEMGSAHMGDLLNAMNEINTSSSNISRIIKVIDDIAFQTNILALNAAVEAARAGQHGKGFAVVAEEVRNLAARSASAAKDTTELIEGSVKSVERGSKIAKETSAALQSIVTGTKNVASLVKDIAAASSEQASGIEQISQGITQVSVVVQSNSAISEETAASSQEMSAQAKALEEQIGMFKLRAKESKESELKAS